MEANCNVLVVLNVVIIALSRSPKCWCEILFSYGVSARLGVFSPPQTQRRLFLVAFSPSFIPSIHDYRQEKYLQSAAELGRHAVNAPRAETLSMVLFTSRLPTVDLKQHTQPDPCKRFYIAGPFSRQLGKNVVLHTAVASSNPMFLRKASVGTVDPEDSRSGKLFIFLRLLQSKRIPRIS